MAPSSEQSSLLKSRPSWLRNRIAGLAYIVDGVALFFGIAHWKPIKNTTIRFIMWWDFGARDLAKPARDE